MNLKNNRVLFIATLLLFIGHAGMCQNELQTNTIVDTIPFELTSHNNISIQAVLGKTDTVNLMFHTAASYITLTTEGAKKVKSIQWNSETDANSWGGSARARYSHSNFLEIGNLEWDSIPIWETINSGPTTDGKFGPNMFEGCAIEIDFDKSVMTIHNSLPIKTDDYVKVPIVFEDDDMFIQGTSTIGGVNYDHRFLVHSGYGGTILFDDKFVLESKIGEQIEIIDTQELKDSYGNVIQVRKGILPHFMLGELDLSNVTVGFFEGTIGRRQMSVIGGDLIKRFNIIIDADRGYMYLQTNGLTDMAYTEF
jgi:hypothetical protein